MGDEVVAEQRFWAEMLIFVGPMFLTVWGAIAVLAPTNGGTSAGTFMGLFWLAIAAALVWQPYVAILGSDGSLTFRSLTRKVVTSAEAVYRISGHAGASPGGAYIFHFDGRRATLQPFGGRTLARCLVERDPTIQAPQRLRSRQT